MATSSRRALLASGAAAVGVAAGYRFHGDLWRWSQRLQGREELLEPPFDREAKRVLERQRRQTVETVRALKAKYEAPVYGKVRVWELFERTLECVDPTDTTLLLTNQNFHVRQILAMMEKDRIQDKELFLVAILHDLGKVLMLHGEVPEHVVGFIEPVEATQPGVGLDNVIYQFGHDEFLYSRLKDHVPERIAMAIRYHSALPQHLHPYMSERDKKLGKDLLDKFAIYDQGSKTHQRMPKIDMAPYRAMIEDAFPQPILL